MSRCIKGELASLELSLSDPNGNYRKKVTKAAVSRWRNRRATQSTSLRAVVPTRSQDGKRSPGGRVVSLETWHAAHFALTLKF